MKYSVGFKESVVRKILPPGERSALSVAKELGISYQTVRNWLTLAKNGTLGGTDSGGALSRPVREKFNLLIQSQSIADSEKGLWLREHGLHSEHLTMYEQELREFMENKSTGDKEENRRLRLENKRLTKELQKKEKALAEMAALYTLKKKWKLSGGRTRKTDCRRETVNGSGAH